MKSDEYHRLVSTFDQRRIEAAINNIPLNINRAGKHYRKLVAKIHGDLTPIRRA